MTNAQRLSRISEEDYLAEEMHARSRHEYVAGMVYAIAGGTYAHNLIASNVLGELHSQLKGKPCRALSSDSKVKIQTNTRTRFYYPDGRCGIEFQREVYSDDAAIIRFPEIEAQLCFSSVYDEVNFVSESDTQELN